MNEERINRLYDYMLNNPEFKEFVKKNKNKTVEEIIKEQNLVIKNVTNSYKVP